MASAAQRRIKSISYAKYGYMFIAPFFLVYCFFQIWPLIQTFILSFQGNGADAGTFVGFDNYATILFGTVPLPYPPKLFDWWGGRTAGVPSAESPRRTALWNQPPSITP